MESKTPVKGRGAKATGAGAGAGEIALEEVEESCVSALLDFIYTGAVTVLETALPALLAASDRLGVLGLRDACAQHLHRELRSPPLPAAAPLDSAALPTYDSPSPRSHPLQCSFFSLV